MENTVLAVKEYVSNQLNTLGNLVPLEWKLNISAKNEYFDRKKASYAKSLTMDAQDLISEDNWYPENVVNRNNIIVKRITDWYNAGV